MKPLYTTEQFQSARSREQLPFECEKCGHVFYGLKNEVQKCISRQKRGIPASLSFRFCSKDCISNGKNYSCKQCGKLVYRTPSSFRNEKQEVFCSSKCSATYLQKDGGHRHWSDAEKEKLRQLAKSRTYFVPGWNKGIRSAPTLILKCRVCGENFIQIISKKNSNKTQTCGKNCRRKMQSENMLLQYKNGKKVYGGTTKWLKYRDIKVQGSYEYRTCIILDKWIDLKRIKQWEYTLDRIPYIGSDGKHHNYLLDFKVWNNDGDFYYLEVKGYERGNDKLKWKAVKDAGFDLKVWFNSDISKEEMNLNGACSITG
jgi:hypothetical protein